MFFALDEKEREVSFLLSTKAYHREALYGASLVFTPRAFVFMEPGGRSRLRITLKAKQPAGKSVLEELAGEFHNELLSQTLRWMVAKHNKKTKEAIEMQALFAAHTKPRRGAK